MLSRRNTIYISFITAVAIILASQAIPIMVPHAYGQEVAPAERAALINSTKKSCEIDRSIAHMGKTIVSKYCDCFALELARAITKQELRITRVTPDLKLKIERASAACRPAGFSPH
jgi:hypothetical protein